MESEDNKLPAEFVCVYLQNELRDIHETLCERHPPEGHSI